MEYGHAKWLCFISANKHPICYMLISNYLIVKIVPNTKVLLKDA